MSKGSSHPQSPPSKASAQHALDPGASPGPPQMHAQRVMEAMQHDLAHHWTLTTLANLVHVSQSQLNRHFKNELGLPPISYLVALRVREMTRLLRATHHSVRDIARAVGWTDQAHAAQQFRKLTGLSPTEYRAKVREAAVVACFWCGQPLPIPASDGDPRVLDGDPNTPT
ncbi:helix-turn-helix domain-containing protein [Brevibacterium luteolum]|uniref:helix-turn-helix domain-containing protein n=2 Tax=Brevibacterium luteolum TaxID=199591 RepID=UPI00349F61E2